MLQFSAFRMEFGMCSFISKRQNHLPIVFWDKQWNGQCKQLPTLQKSVWWRIRFTIDRYGECLRFENKIENAKCFSSKRFKWKYWLNTKINSEDKNGVKQYCVIFIWLWFWLQRVYTGFYIFVSVFLYRTFIWFLYCFFLIIMQTQKWIFYYSARKINYGNVTYGCEKMKYKMHSLESRKLKVWINFLYALILLHE